MLREGQAARNPAEARTASRHAPHEPTQGCTVSSLGHVPEEGDARTPILLPFPPCSFLLSSVVPFPISHFQRTPPCYREWRKIGDTEKKVDTHGYTHVHVSTHMNTYVCYAVYLVGALTEREGRRGFRLPRGEKRSTRWDRLDQTHIRSCTRIHPHIYKYRARTRYIHVSSVIVQWYGMRMSCICTSWRE